MPRPATRASKWWASLVAALLVAGGTTSPLLAQHESGSSEHHHAVPGEAPKIALEDDAASRVLTVRVGPVDLPVQGQVPLPLSFLTVPLEGWLVAYSPRLVDDGGRILPGQLLHHVDFFNPARRSLVCPWSDEYFFAAGSETGDWPAVPGVGYRVSKGGQIGVTALFHNATDTPFSQIYLEVRMKYQLLSDATLKNIYPAIFSVTGCGPTSYHLDPGRTVKGARFTISFPGTLLALGGHLHDHARQLELENVTRSQPIARLEAKLTPNGRLLSVPIVFLGDQSISRLSRGDVVRVTAIYESPASQRLPKAAMAMAVGYFLPDDEEAYRQARAKRPPLSARREPPGLP